MTRDHSSPAPARAGRLAGALSAALLLAGCGALFGDDPNRSGCSTSADSPARPVCAPGQGVCWADPVAPSVSAVTVTCSTSPCRRDATLTVEADLADDQEVGGGSVTLDLDGDARQVAMAPVGGTRWRATLALAVWPLDLAERAAVATVTAHDGARNASAAVVAGAGQRPVVTRVVGAIVVGPNGGTTPTAPAVDATGTVYVGGGDKRLYALAPGASVAVAMGVTVPAAITQPPSVGSSALWVAAGNRLHAVSLDGSALLNGAGYDTGGAITGPAAITTGLAQEVAFVGSLGGRLAGVKAVAEANGFIGMTPASDPFSVAPVIVEDTPTVALFAVTSSSGPPIATLRSLTFDGAFREGTTRSIGQSVSAPIAASLTTVWTGSADLNPSALVASTVAGGAAISVALTSSVTGGPIILADGSVAISVATSFRRFSSAGVELPGSPTTLSGGGLTPIAIAGGPVAFLVPTTAGTVDAIDAAGTLRWSATLAQGQALREGTVGPVDPATGISPAWFTSADGKLHALLIDGHLDTAAPWPKAWHDARNSGHLGAGP
jgi:hypothetical protein